MITVMDSVKDPMGNSENGLDSQLWHACAGGMVQMPRLNSKVFYFPQGHAEHAHGDVHFGNFRIPSLILCRVAGIKYMADPETDEVYAKIRLIPVKSNDFDIENDGFDGNDGADNPEKPASFAKTLTQSDANNGGGFSVPRYCAETIFPRLDYSAEPPVQTILAKDVHGDTWKFRHIYRGTPRRHLLTTGWSNFVNQKKLVAGDSIVFLRAENGDLCVGIRRAKRGISGGLEYPSGWNSGARNCGSPFRGYSVFVKGDESKLMGSGDMRGKVKVESVVEAVSQAANKQPFEVVYYPRASTPEFCVKASAVGAAMQVQWCPGMRFKMAFETEDSSRISWFMGTISSVQVADPALWPDSPWRLLQVAWDEPDLLQNVKCVNPWLVELVSNMPAVHFGRFSPPRKKLRVPPHPDFPINSQFSVPGFPSNLLRSNSPLCCISDNITAGIQGARHSQLGLSPPDLYFNNNLQTGLFPVRLWHPDHTPRPSQIPKANFLGGSEDGENVSCLLTMGNPKQSQKENSEIKTPHILLFGQVILADQQSSQSCSGDTIGNCLSDGNQEKTANLSDGSGSSLHQNGLTENSSDDGSPWYKDHQKADVGSETGQCKVFMESEDVGRTLDLSVFGSYQELYEKLATMFGIESAEMLSNVLYKDDCGVVKHTGDEPFSVFLKTARRLTILTDSGSDNIVWG